MARKKKKKRTHIEEEITEKTPRSFIFKRGKVGNSVRELVSDLRKVMLPHTALNLQEQDRNSIKDFINVAGPIGVTHFIIFSATDIGTYMRLVKVPQGPTLTFKVHQYTLQNDLARIQNNVHSITYEHKTPPILIMNNFNSDESHMKLMSVAFQNLFPTLNVKEVDVSDCKRAVLLSYDKETNIIEFRHYLITSSQLGMSKSIKRIVQRKIGDISNLTDISDYVFSGKDASESDVEDLTNENKVVIDGKRRTTQNAIKLHEIGPRMQLELFKIEEGISTGEVLYHSVFVKTKEEEESLKAVQERKRKLRQERRREQERRVRRKKGIVEEKEDEEEEGEE